MAKGFFAVLLGLASTGLWGAAVEVGMDRAKVVELLGAPAKQLGTAEKSILHWDSVVVTFRGDKVVAFEEKTAVVRRAATEQEAAFLATAQEMRKGFNHGIVKEAYAGFVERLLETAGRLERAPTDKRLLVRVVEYAEIHRTVLNMWKTEVVLDAAGKVVDPATVPPNTKRTIFVSKERNPAGYALIEEAKRHGRFRPVGGDEASFEIESVYGLWNYTEWRYWNPVESRLRELNVDF